ncbi:MAG: hypothetical protein ACO1SV_12420 [Fimbriimonas sp.]
MLEPDTRVLPERHEVDRIARADAAWREVTEQNRDALRLTHARLIDRIRDGEESALEEAYALVRTAQAGLTPLVEACQVDVEGDPLAILNVGMAFQRLRVASQEAGQLVRVLLIDTRRSGR